MGAISWAVGPILLWERSPDRERGQSSLRSVDDTGFGPRSFLSAFENLTETLEADTRCSIARSERSADATRILPRFGRIWKTPYWDVLVMRTDQAPYDLLESLRLLTEQDATLSNSVARLVPAMETFTYHTPEEFREQVRVVAEPWAADLVGSTFHVRMHRRGFKGQLASHTEERTLGEYLLECVHSSGGTAHVDFDDPHWIIDVETVGIRAGMSRWSRNDLERYAFPLRID